MENPYVTWFVGFLMGFLIFQFGYWRGKCVAHMDRCSECFDNLREQLDKIVIKSSVQKKE